MPDFKDCENCGRGVVTATYIQIEKIKMDDFGRVGRTTTLVGVKMDNFVRVGSTTTLVGVKMDSLVNS